MEAQAPRPPPSRMAVSSTGLSGTFIRALAAGRSADRSTGVGAVGLATGAAALSSSGMAVQLTGVLIACPIIAVIRDNAASVMEKPYRMVPATKEKPETRMVAVR